MLYIWQSQAEISDISLYEKIPYSYGPLEISDHAAKIFQKNFGPDCNYRSFVDLKISNGYLHAMVYDYTNPKEIKFPIRRLGSIE
jgi:hypothetical protein